MGLQPSASKTELLLLCPRPFDPELEAALDEPGEPARYGSAFHRVMAACLRSPKKKPLEKAAGFARAIDRAAAEYDVKDARQELASHVKSSVKVLRNWLTREKLEVAEIERAYSIWPKADGTWKARVIEAHDENHHYKTPPGEIPGTLDLTAQSANKKRTVVMDHKTGFWEDWFAADEEDPVKFARPTTVAQLRTLGLVAGSKDVETAIFHADRKGLPIVYSEPYDTDQQRAHSKELYAALSRVGQGFLRAGSYCKRCPARVSCPARAAETLTESATVLLEVANKYAIEPLDPTALHVIQTDEKPEPGIIEMRAGKLYDLVKRFQELEKHALEEIKKLVKAGAVIENRKGEVLTIRTQSFETLSKKSVLEALGAVQGQRELARMRKKGLIRESSREMLVGEK